VVLFIVVVVATSVLYLALDAMGVFTSVNDSLTDLVSAGGGQSTSGFQITAKGVILSSALIGLVNAGGVRLQRLRGPGRRHRADPRRARLNHLGSRGTAERGAPASVRLEALTGPHGRRNRVGRARSLR
jgi:hypothetical protein